MRIITTVGTSLITNSLVDCDALEDQIFDLKLFEPGSNLERAIQQKENELLNFLNNNGTSAEIDSLKKIDPEGTAEIYLLCTETVPSYICGRVIRNYLSPANVVLKEIAGLQIKDAKKFENEGFFNLVEAVTSISKDYAGVKLNISGGYKALIPPLTLLAQLERIPLYYLYEGSDELIETGSLPIDFDWVVIEKYGSFLNNENKRNGAIEDLIIEMRDLRLVKAENRELTIIGKLLAKYSSKASPFTSIIFGYLIEYKIHECYSKEYGRENVEHSVKIEGLGSGDIDILITFPEDSQKFIAVEIKPFDRLEEKSKLDDITDNFIKRVNGVAKKRGTPIELWLLVYDYTDSPKSEKDINESVKSMLQIVASKLQDAINTDLIFKVKYFPIQKNNLTQERHVYQRFMKSALKIDTIKDIFSSKNK